MTPVNDIPIDGAAVNTRKKSRSDSAPVQTLQDIVNVALRRNIDMNIFKIDAINVHVKNTVNVKCKTCGSDNVFVESRQVRSADEAMTKFYTCLNCGNKWRVD